MQLEFRADGAHISGYVNVTEKKSRPVMTPHGRVVEEIEPRAFEAAIQRAGNITLTVDHDDSHIYADTKNGTLKLYEDNIGLHADVLIADPDLIKIAAGAVRPPAVPSRPAHCTCQNSSPGCAPFWQS